MSAPVISFEFFPPRDEAGRQRLVDAARQLQARQPQYVSVTFGAGGSTREGTLSACLDLQGLGLTVAPHLSCVASTRGELVDILGRYRQHGIARLVALRGDLPSGIASLGELRHASELVALVREATGDWFHIEVAAYPEMHPQARSPEDDLRHFVAKMKAGADSAITQYFYNPDAYFDFVDRACALGVTAAIVPGIMPITNFTQLARFSDACGAEIPRWIRLRLQSYGDDRESIRAFGRDVVVQLCQDLLDGGAPGLHFYSMNQAQPTLDIISQLEL
jgi:methylenetetrahydrofolate reductase (NADPH)